MSATRFIVLRHPRKQREPVGATDRSSVMTMTSSKNWSTAGLAVARARRRAGEVAALAMRFDDRLQSLGTQRKSCSAPAESSARSTAIAAALADLRRMLTMRLLAVASAAASAALERAHGLERCGMSSRERLESTTDATVVGVEALLAQIAAQRSYRKVDERDCARRHCGRRRRFDLRQRAHAVGKRSSGRRLDQMRRSPSAARRRPSGSLSPVGSRRCKKARQRVELVGDGHALRNCLRQLVSGKRAASSAARWRGDVGVLAVVLGVK
jgi:hypothetical protein